MPDEQCEKHIREQLGKLIPVLKRVINEDYVGGIELPEMDDAFKETRELIKEVVIKIEEKNSRLLTLYERDYTHLRSWLKSILSGVLMFDKNRQVILANSALKEITGLSDVQLNLKNVISLLEKGGKDKPEDFLYAQVREGVWNRIGFEEAIEMMMGKGLTLKYAKIPVGDRYFEVHLNPVRNEEEEVSGGVMIMHDVTLMVEVDEMKTEFVSVASHQLRTPLTAMRLYAEMLLDGNVGDLNQGQKEYVQNLQDSTLRMIKLVNEFLNVSRLETGRLKIEPELVQVEELTGKVLSDLAPLIEKRRCQITFDKPGESMLKLAVDQGLMYEILNNLIINAVSYSPENGGRVQVKIERATLVDSKDGKMVKVGDSEAGQGQADYILIAVKDNGIGIPIDAQDKIFSKFFRADNAIRRKSDGSGLGLYLVKLITDEAGCKVWFDTVEGEGSTFFLAIPIYGMLRKKGEKSIAA